MHVVVAEGVGQVAHEEFVFHDVSIEESAAQRHAARCTTPENIEWNSDNVAAGCKPPGGRKQCLEKRRSVQRLAARRLARYASSCRAASYLTSRARLQGQLPGTGR